MWQLTNGHAFIQMIYSRDDELLDCEYLSEPKFVRQFVTKYYHEVYEAEKARNLSTTSSSHYQPESVHHNIKFRHYMKNEEESTIDLTDTDGDAFGMRNLTYHRLWTEADVPKDLLAIMDYDVLKQQCDERHRQMQRIVNDLGSHNEDTRQNATDHLNR